MKQTMQILFCVGAVVVALALLRSGLAHWRLSRFESICRKFWKQRGHGDIKGPNKAFKRLKARYDRIDYLVCRGGGRIQERAVEDARKFRAIKEVAA